MKKVMDGGDILYNLYVRGDPDAEARVDEERKRVRLISELRELRERAGISRTVLARKLRMTASEIAQLEDPDNDIHSLEDLQRAASALGMQLELRIVARTGKRRRGVTAGAA